MWRSSNWAEGFYIDIHEKYHCFLCSKDFIAGKELMKSSSKGAPFCPYCGHGGAEVVVSTEEDQLEELADDLGCLGIYIDESEE